MKKPVRSGSARAARSPQPRSEAKRARILETATRHFAQRGYHGARTDDIAGELGIAKGSVFQHFKTKEALFLAAYKKAAGSLQKYLDAPPDVRDAGFFAVTRHWLSRAENLAHEAWIPYRVVLVGNYGTELRLRRDIHRWLAAEDPYGSVAFVRWGIERGEVREDVDPRMIASLVDWMVERFQDALVMEELDPGLFPRRGGRAEDTQGRVDQFLEVIRSAVGRG